ncbi:hypothetical protein IL306_007343 [Fusarium sp. DS 682]|nr:hypothetical protein IL306_007343 [Fusarium sp. DS 682]
MSSFPFERLPPELRKKVVLHALPDLTAPVRRIPNSRSVSFFTRSVCRTLKNLEKSDPEIRTLVHQIRCLKGVDIWSGYPIMASWNGPHLRLDPIHDTFKVLDMGFPQVRPSKAWNPVEIGAYHRHALPLQNIITTADRPYLERGGVAPTTAGSSTAAPAHTDPSYHKMDLEPDLPIFSRLPKVKNLSLVIQNAGREWRIDGFQSYGPDIVVSRPQSNRWGTSRVGEHSESLESWFSMRQIPGDTGIPWRFVTHDNLSDPEDVQGIPNEDLPHSHPNIGYLGYSRGYLSIGGNWAGFRFWVDTNKVEFSPLSFNEVANLVQDNDSQDANALRRPHPGFVARVWVIRSEKDLEPTEQPHHHWIQVNDPRAGDPVWVEQVASTWKMTRHMLSHGRNGTSINQEGEGEYLSRDIYEFQMEPVD